jgi:hypothetical protein
VESKCARKEANEKDSERNCYAKIRQNEKLLSIEQLHIAERVLLLRECNRLPSRDASLDPLPVTGAQHCSPQAGTMVLECNVLQQAPNDLL